MLFPNRTLKTLSLTVTPRDGDAHEGGDKQDDSTSGIVVKQLEHVHPALKADVTDGQTTTHKNTNGLHL